MVLKITLTPLYGARTDDHALATLLTLDGLNILLDCGWNSQFDPAFLENLAKVAPSIQVVLISHPDPAHLAALPYAVAKLGLTAPIFATLPVWRMGQMFMYDTYLSEDAQKPFSLFNLDDVDATFDYAIQDRKSAGFTMLKYQQHFPLDSFENGQNVVITPHRAGHTVGGTVWNITKGTESLVYAVHINHRKERHLNATTLVNFSRPSHLIVSATNALTKTESATGSDRLLDVLQKTIKRGGHTLIPADTAGRVIELAVLLETAWEADASLRGVTVAVLNPLAKRAFSFARSMIEWMSDEVVRRFDISRDNLFEFKHVKLLEASEHLDALNSPCVVLASCLSMERGYSRELFVRWCGDKRNSVVLVDRPEPNTLYARLFEACASADAGAGAGAGVANRKPRGEDGNSTAAEMSKSLNGLEMTLSIGRKVPLQGDELEHWREQERNRKRLEAERKRKEDEEERAKAEEAERLKLEQEEEEAKAKDEGGADDGKTGAEAGEEKKEDVAVDVEMESEAETKGRVFDEEVLTRLEEMDVISSKAGDTFPYGEDGNEEWDDYGQKIDTVRFIFGEDPGEGGLFEDEEKPEIKKGKEVGVVEVLPTKYVEESVQISVWCEVAIADCSGISDGDSMKRLLKEVEPRHVTVIGGNEKETEYLAAHLRKTMGAVAGSGPDRAANGSDLSLIATPKVMEAVDITSDMNVYEVSLDDRVVETVEWDDIGLARIGFMQGRMTDKVDEKMLPVVGPGDMDDGEASDGAGHGTYFVGTVMLNKLKDRLVETGMKAEFAGGALCVENHKTGAVVVVKKVAGQHIVVDGAFSEDYLKVRDMLYSEVVIPR